jgi:hypothetical protein
MELVAAPTVDEELGSSFSSTFGPMQSNLRLRNSHDSSGDKG